MSCKRPTAPYCDGSIRMRRRSGKSWDVVGRRGMSWDDDDDDDDDGDGDGDGDSDSASNDHDGVLFLYAQYCWYFDFYFSSIMIVMNDV